MYTPFQPQHLFVTQDALFSPYTQEILGRVPHLKPIIVENIYAAASKQLPDSIVLARQKGSFFKQCPGTQKYICCGYKILNLLNNCELNCSYCILQGYLNNPHITVYVNIDDLFSELDKLFRTQPKRWFRIGTGELADSLSTDHLTHFSAKLVSYFSDKSRALLELKTKTTNIEHFLHSTHGGRTCVSWSMNTPRLIASDESDATSLDERLQAAQQCQEAGFHIGFHFDPMIYYDQWKEEYRMVIDRIFTTIPASSILWISLGALRYPPHLDSIIRQRHPESKIVYGEMITGLDGKMRYFKSIRIQMFKAMYQWIRQYSHEVFIYLCMESPEIYHKAFGWDIKTSSQLSRQMNKLIQ